MPASEGNEGGTRTNRPWCLFRCAGTPYALGLESVCEVIEVERLVQLPLCPPRIRGLCNFRREVVPVVGLSEHAGGTEGVSTRQLLLILRSGQGLWALQIAPEGTVVSSGVLEGPAPASAPGSAGPVLLGTVRYADANHAAIDPEATWRSVRDRVEGWYADDWCRGASRRGEKAPATAKPLTNSARGRP